MAGKRLHVMEVLAAGSLLSIWLQTTVSLAGCLGAQSATMPPTSGLPDCQSTPSTAGHSSSVILHCMSVSSGLHHLGLSLVLSCFLADFIWPSILSYSPSARDSQRRQMPLRLSPYSAGQMAGRMELTVSCRPAMMRRSVRRRLARVLTTYP